MLQGYMLGETWAYDGCLMFLKYEVKRKQK